MVNYLDIRTLALMMGVVSITLAVGVVYLQWYHKTYAGFSLWSNGAVCAGVGGILMCMRGYAPQLVSIIAANTLLVLFMSFVAWGMEKFVGRRIFRWPDYVVLLLFIGALLQFTYIKPSVEVRIVIISFCFSYFSGKAIFLLKYGGDHLRHPLLLGALWFTAVWFLLRAIITVIGPWEINDFMKAGAFHGVTLVVYIVNQILVMIALVFANHHRLETDLTESNLSLKDSEERFRSLSDASFEGILITENGEIIDANQTFLEMVGYSKEEVIEMSIIDFVAPEMQQDVLERILSNFEGSYETLASKKDGTAIPIEVHGRMLFYQDRMVRVAAIRDLSERKKAQDLLAESQKSFNSLTDHAREGIVVVQNKRLLYINPSMCKMTGYDKDSLLGLESFLPLIAPEARETMMANHLKRLAGKASPERYESKFLKRDGTTYPVELTGVLINWNGSPATLNIISDISERKEAEESMRFLAHHDSLTGLPNRYLLMERLEQALSQARRSEQPLGVLFIDLNGFKQVNDTHGHDVGDMLLNKVTDRLQGLLRDSDTLARMGGDEFVILLPQVDGKAGVEALMARIDSAFQSPFDLGQLTIKSRTSVGFSLFPESGESADELLRVADQQMYHDKNTKK
ncbi:PAS domain S-box protein [Desulfosarcina ovata]|uniref:Diguanylate cyclase n=1 Tax=Desulfosarcina ovata subsp. ovata TaxID=2752305 RepID=A0A5K8AFN4_9BACT|nr:PAS domain S-box protein [Desulfosarcina ovata]BBO91401.1 hypothetical protein DSCOOX_45810 [Desulfosarcina ovata subsp. ovata]